jgi:hypothetical protein
MAKILRLYKQKHTLKNRETKIVCRGLRYLDKLVGIEKKKRNKREEETRQES